MKKLTASVDVDRSEPERCLRSADHWHPHMMVYLPYYENSILGNNNPQSALPTIGDDTGTPFAVGVVPIDDGMAIKARP